MKVRRMKKALSGAQALRSKTNRCRIQFGLSASRIETAWKMKSAKTRVSLRRSFLQASVISVRRQKKDRCILLVVYLLVIYMIFCNITNELSLTYASCKSDENVNQEKYALKLKKKIFLKH